MVGNAHHCKREGKSCLKGMESARNKVGEFQRGEEMSLEASASLKAEQNP